MSGLDCWAERERAELGFSQGAGNTSVSRTNGFLALVAGCLTECNLVNSGRKAGESVNGLCIKAQRPFGPLLEAQCSPCRGAWSPDIGSRLGVSLESKERKASPWAPWNNSADPRSGTTVCGILGG